MGKSKKAPANIDSTTDIDAVDDSPELTPAESHALHNHASTKGFPKEKLCQCDLCKQHRGE